MPVIDKYLNENDMTLLIGAELRETIVKFMGEYEKTVTRLTAAGMPNSEIRKLLEADLARGGRLFGQFKNGLGRGVGYGLGDVAGGVSEKVQYEKGVRKFKWITVSTRPCPDCNPRHNRVETMATWKRIGKPRSGFSVCQSACKCRLVAGKYKKAIKDPVVRKKSHLDSNMAGKHKTIKDAEAWANHNYKNIQFDYDGVALEAANRTNKQFKLLAKEWPEVTERLEYVGTYRNYSPKGKVRTPAGNVKYYDRVKDKYWMREDKLTTYAEAHYGNGTTIGLNPKYFDNIEMFKSKLRDNVRTELHPLGCDTIESVITHEWGHMVDGWIKSLSNDLSIVKYYSARDSAGKIKDMFINFKVAWGTNGKARRAVSRYACDELPELWAEGFAQSYHCAAHLLPEYTKSLKVFLDIVLDKSRWTRPAGILTDMPPGAEKNNIKEFLKQLREDLGL